MRKPYVCADHPQVSKVTVNTFVTGSYENQVAEDFGACDNSTEKVLEGHICGSTALNRDILDVARLIGLIVVNLIFIGIEMAVWQFLCFEHLVHKQPFEFRHHLRFGDPSLGR